MRYYLSVHPDTHEVLGTVSDSRPEPKPEKVKKGEKAKKVEPLVPVNVDENGILVEVDEKDLGGKLPGELLAEKLPIFGGSPLKITKWEDRVTGALTVAQSAAAPDDGMAVRITVTGGPALGAFRASPSRPTPCTLPGGLGKFDSSGKATFDIKVWGQTDLVLAVRSEDGSSVEHAVEIVPFGG